MRFTIKDLLWLTTLIAIAAAWYVDRSTLKRTNVSLVQSQIWLRDSLMTAFDLKKQEAVLLTRAIYRAHPKAELTRDDRGQLLSVTLEPEIVIEN